MTWCNKPTFNGTLCDLLEGHSSDCISEATAQKVHGGHAHQMTYGFLECPRMVCSYWRKNTAKADVRFIVSQQQP